MGFGFDHVMGSQMPQKIPKRHNLYCVDKYLYKLVTKKKQVSKQLVKEKKSQVANGDTKTTVTDFLEISSEILSYKLWIRTRSIIQRKSFL